ncbi:MAG: AI-2E family transporter [Prevotellaceae bacterium]|jgi:predicted PurR-regulated permease PerM|nr:AI-2E family transporter [Prevotellaceae bacterium]
MSNSHKKPFTFDRVVRIIIGITITVVLFLLVRRLSGVLLPFLIAWLIAYMMYPLVKLYQYKLRLQSRMLSILLAFITIAIVLFGILAIVIPPLINEISRTGDLFSTYLTHLEQSTILPLDLKKNILDWVDKTNLESLLKKDYFTQGIEKMLPHFWLFVSNSIDFIISLFIVVVIFLYTIFILTDYERINNGWIEFVPKKYRVIVNTILEDLETGMNRYFRGQALIAGIVGVMLATGFTIIGLPLGLLLGLIMGAFAMIPYLNAVMLPALAFFAFLKSMETGQPLWIALLSVAAVFIIVQATMDLFLTPRIMGKTMGLKPAVILLSLSIWGSLLGIAGMIIALPATTILISYYRRFIIGKASLSDISSNKKTEVISDKE